jgi:hypothetical protein
MEPMDERVDCDSPVQSRRPVVFDDPTVGLKQEPFVSGGDAIIDRLVQEIPDAESVLPWSSPHNRFPGSKLSSSGAVKSSAGTGTTALR